MKIEVKDSIPLFVLCLSLSMALFNPTIRDSEVLRIGWAIIHIIIAVGYVVGLVTLKAIRNLSMEDEKVQEWAFNMACMFEDCTYLSHEQFMKDARIHLENLIELVGQWTPPEIRDQNRTEIMNYRSTLDIDSSDHLFEEYIDGTKYLVWIKYNEVFDYFDYNFARLGQ